MDRCSLDEMKILGMANLIKNSRNKEVWNKFVEKSKSEKRVIELLEEEEKLR